MWVLATTVVSTEFIADDTRLPETQELVLRGDYGECKSSLGRVTGKSVRAASCKMRSAEFHLRLTKHFSRT